MKRISTILFLWITATLVMKADVTIGSKCEVFLPGAFYSHTVIYKADADKIATSSDYGQSQQPSGSKRYWIAYSDRDENTTYNTSSTSSSVYSHLRFGEKVRIAKIQNGFALVYREPAEQSQYPNISFSAKTRGWVPMKNLLLWTTAPVPANGHYQLALINGDTLHSPIPRFIMKQSEDGKILLSKQFTLEGTGEQQLYGWVDEQTCIILDNQCFIEPNWNLKDISRMQNKDVVIYKDTALTEPIASYKLGTINNMEKEDSLTLFRLPKDEMRLPLLIDETIDGSLFKCLVIEPSFLNFSFRNQTRSNYFQSIEIGYTPRFESNGTALWKPILFISADEFNNLMQRLAPVNHIATQNTDDRKKYVDALKALLRSQIPNITENDLDNQSIGKIMALISGFSESFIAIEGPTLDDILDPKIVSDNQYKDLLSKFAHKYRELQNIKSKGYHYKLDFNNAIYYWLPIEESFGAFSRCKDF